MILSTSEIKVEDFGLNLRKTTQHIIIHNKAQEWNKFKTFSIKDLRTFKINFFLIMTMGFEHINSRHFILYSRICLLFSKPQKYLVIIVLYNNFLLNFNTIKWDQFYISKKSFSYVSHVRTHFMRRLWKLFLGSVSLKERSKLYVYFEETTLFRQVMLLRETGSIKICFQLNDLKFIVFYRGY